MEKLNLYFCKELCKKLNLYFCKELSIKSDRKEFEFVVKVKSAVIDRVCTCHLPEHITFSINFKENCDARDVVYHSVIFFPLLGTRPHYCVARLLRAILNVVGPDDPGNCLV